MEIKNIVNSNLAIALCGFDENGEDEVFIISGKLIQKNKTFYLERNEGKKIMIMDEWMSRIKIIPEDLKEMFLDCDYQINLSLGESNEAEGDLIPWGLNLQEAE